MGQVWSKADFDGTNKAGYQGGRGSVLAVTAQNPGPDDVFGSSDDVLAPLNQLPVPVSIDNAPGNDCRDPLDRVRSFFSFHRSGANFLFADGSVRFIDQTINAVTYRALSTIDGGGTLDRGETRVHLWARRICLIALSRTADTIDTSDRAPLPHPHAR